MHLAVDLGGKLTSGKPYWRDFGAKLGHFMGDVEAKSGYGIGHMSDIVRPCCWICVPKVLSPRNTKI